MKAIILFDTLFGNTEKIARSLASGLQEAGVQADCVNIRAARIDELAEYDLLALGAPTQYLTASKPLKEFLERLKGLDLKGRRAFAFDTKLDSRLSGSAAKFIEKKLQELGLDIIRQRSSAIVVGQKKGDKVGEAVLKGGMEDLFKQVGKELGALLSERQKVGAA
jgi:flavorubredoxin